MTELDAKALAAAKRKAPPFWRDTRDADKHFAAVLRAYLSALPSTHKLVPVEVWRPIETAPRDGTRILCVCAYATTFNEEHIGFMAVDYWRHGTGFGKFNQDHWPATHWMPLPAVPLASPHQIRSKADG